MELLEQRILKEGRVKPGGILKVDSFLNHQIDPQLLYEMALELKRLYAGEGVNKIFTIVLLVVGVCLVAGYFIATGWIADILIRIGGLVLLAIGLIDLAKAIR